MKHDTYDLLGRIAVAGKLKDAEPHLVAMSVHEFTPQSVLAIVYREGRRPEIGFRWIPDDHLRKTFDTTRIPYNPDGKDRDKLGKYKTVADLKGKKAAQSLSSNFARLAEQSGAELVGTDGFDQSVQLVATGRADATVNDSLSFLDFHKQKPNAPVQIAAEQQDADASGIILRKNNPALKAAIDKALEAIKDVTWYPEWGQARIEGMVAGRPDWTISRMP